ncbi:MAG: hypothetical protein E7359_00665 [Clostridiales bacterium]|nr:hypothetical protein [Clostridiales bacterium]
MRYIKLSFKYLIKNILYLFLMSLIPAVLFGGLLSPFKFIEFINNYTSLTIVSFSNMFHALIDVSWLKVLFYVICLGVLGLVVSIIIGAIENHFRSGKKNYLKIKNYINNNLLVVLLNIILIFVINFIVSFLCATLIYLFHIMFAGLNSSANVGCVIVAIIVFALYFCVMAIVSMTLLLNIPNMLINGYNFKQSISNTINVIGKNFINLLLAYILPYAVIIPLISIFSFSSVAIHIVSGVCMVISIMYYSSFVMTAYFDLNNIMRYDNRKYYNI